MADRVVDSPTRIQTKVLTVHLLEGIMELWDLYVGQGACLSVVLIKDLVIGCYFVLVGVSHGQLVLNEGCSEVIEQAEHLAKELLISETEGFSTSKHTWTGWVRRCILQGAGRRFSYWIVGRWVRLQVFYWGYQPYRFVRGWHLHSKPRRGGQ